MAYLNFYHAAPEHFTISEEPAHDRVISEDCFISAFNNPSENNYSVDSEAAFLLPGDEKEVDIISRYWKLEDAFYLDRIKSIVIALFDRDNQFEVKSESRNLLEIFEYQSAAVNVKIRENDSRGSAYLQHNHSAEELVDIVKNKCNGVINDCDTMLVLLEIEKLEKLIK